MYRVLVYLRFPSQIRFPVLVLLFQILISFDTLALWYSFAYESSNLLSVIIFMHLLCCAMIIAFNLILLECTDRFELQLISSLYITFSESATNFLFCFLAENITIALSNISDLFYSSMWFRLPIKQQKLITLTIARSQQEFHLQGLGLIPCSLSSFLQVICSSAKIFSFY